MSVIVPMFNEAATLTPAMGSLVGYLESLGQDYRFEVIIVDDGSTDDTRRLAEELASESEIVRVLSHGTNLRLGQALRTGFRASTGAYVVTFDADLTYSPDHIGKLLETITVTAADVVVASPYMKGGQVHGVPPFRRALSGIANRFLSLTAQGHLATITGLVRAYDGPFIRAMNLKAIDFDVNTEIIYKAQLLRAQIIEIPAILDWRTIVQRRRISGFRNRLYWNTAKQLVSGFLFRPYLFFLAPGAALLVISLGCLTWWVAVEQTTVPLFLAVGTFVLASLLLCVAVVTVQAKRYFEELFHLSTAIRRESERHRDDRGSAPGPA